MDRIVLVLALIAGATAGPAVEITADARTLAFTGGVVPPAGGAHPHQPLISQRETVQTIHESDFRVLEIVYR